MNAELAKAFSVFGLMLLTDVCWVLAVRRIKDGSALKAGLWSVILMLFASLTTIGYVHDMWLIVPTCLGSGAGTMIGVWLDARKGVS